MKEKFLLKVSLACSIAGVILLFIFSNEINIEDKEISRLENNEYAVLKGKITKIYEKDDLMIAELSQYNHISVVIFKEDYLDLRIGDNIEVMGKTSEYEGELEIIADEVRLI